MFLRHESLKEFVRKYPLVSLLVLINACVFALLEINGGSKNPLVLIQYGAFFKPLILEGEWYRFVTSMFLHIGFGHLFFNMFSLVIFAPILEKWLGKMKFTLLYFVGGIGGTIACYFFQGAAVSAGASGAIYGLFGFLTFLAYYKKILGNAEKQILLPILVINFAITFLMPGISVAGHIGGFVAGYLMGFLEKKRTRI